jgi:hypothetical protein
VCHRGSFRTSDTNAKTSSGGRAIDVRLSTVILPLPSRGPATPFWRTMSYRRSTRIGARKADLADRRVRHGNARLGELARHLVGVSEGVP